jgi:uncharacterized iron-regulated membrane protein
MSEHLGERALVPAHRETSDITFRLATGLLALAGVLLLLLLGLAWLMFPGEVNDQRFAQPFPEWPGPRLQTDAAADMKRFQAEEMRWLNSAGWQDRSSKTVHIPIDQAMRAVAAEGISGWPAGDPAASQGDRR